MKPTTQVYMKFENKGKPLDGKTLQKVALKDMIRELIGLLAKVYMGSKIVITIGRDLESIDSGTTSAMMDDFDDYMAAFDDSEQPTSAGVED